MTVVSSFGHLDMDPSKSKARGVELLRTYLEYAANNGMRHGDRGAIQTPMNDFEQTVHDALVRRGIDVIPQWGASQYRIDLVAKHPQRPGQFVLAIECDGATYHSACTARERDRLRQQHLEALGWRFHRIWSTDWFIDPDSEIARVEKAYQEALTSKRCVERPQSQTRTSAADAPGPAPSAGIQRPFVAKRNKIDDYSEADLDSMVRWVSSSSLRTDDEIVAEVRRELGFVRRGTRIEAAIRAAIARVGGSSTATVM
jgi:very-short-patch-repair endonuclease